LELLKKIFRGNNFLEGISAPQKLIQANSQVRSENFTTEDILLQIIGIE
jgi:hypothetical protein